MVVSVLAFLFFFPPLEEEMAHGFRGLSWWGGHGEGELFTCGPTKYRKFKYFQEITMKLLGANDMSVS